MSLKCLIPIAFLFMLNTACNKVIEEVESPPFSAFPNPCTDLLLVAFDDGFFLGNPVRVRLLDGDKVLLDVEALTTVSPLAIDMESRTPGVYHVEVRGNGKTFTQPILKTD